MINFPSFGDILSFDIQTQNPIDSCGVAQSAEMQLFLPLVLLLSLSFDALAAPAPRPARKSRSFQIERVKRSDYVAHGPTALRKAFRKFGIPSIDFSNITLNDFEPFDLKTSAVKTNQNTIDEPDQAGAVSATSVQGDVEFISPVTIGGQTVNMDFDTGSADMYVDNNTLCLPAQSPSLT